MAVCSQCGSEDITFRREGTGTVSNTTSVRKKKGSSSRASVGILSSGDRTSNTKSSKVTQSVRGYRTVGMCNSCGFTWEVQNEVAKNNKPRNYNKTVDLILCICLGYLGVHKFYEGSIGMGVLYLCTGGLCGIGWIVDIIKIARKPD